MQNRNWFKSNSAQRRIFGGWTTPSKRKEPPLPAPWLCAVILIALVLSLSGCATRSPVLCPEPVLPPMPALSEPIPPVSYSLRAQQSFKQWQELLIGTPQTPKPW